MYDVAGDIGNELRWILLAGGVLLLSVIALVGRWRRGQAVGDANEVELPRQAHDVRGEIPELRDEVASAHAGARVSRAEFGRRAVELPMSPLPEVWIDDEPAPIVDVVIDPRSSFERIAVQDEPPTAVSAEMTSMTSDSEAAPIELPIDSVEPPMVTAATLERIESDLTAPLEPVAAEPAPTAPSPKPRPRKIVALRLTSADKRFDGAQLQARLAAEHLCFGEYSIFHCYDEQGRTVFSLANLLEPGSFDLTTMPALRFAGVALFMQLPNGCDGAASFERMLACARNLERELGGILQDERGAPLSVQRTARLREEIVDFEHLFGVRPAQARTGAGDSLTS